MKFDIKNKKNWIYIFLIIFIVSTILFLIVIDNVEKVNENNKTALEKKTEKLKEVVTEDLSKKTEQERIEYYCSRFFKQISNKDYKASYELLYPEYKENNFPTYSSFEKYMIKYFPEEIALRYNNIERLGEIYVIWVDVKDALNGSYGKNFSLKVVIKENGYDDFQLSFSRDSAVNTGTEE